MKELNDTLLHHKRRFTSTKHVHEMTNTMYPIQLEIQRTEHSEATTGGIL